MPILNNQAINAGGKVKEKEKQLRNKYQNQLKGLQLPAGLASFASDCLLSADWLHFHTGYISM